MKICLNPQCRRKVKIVKETAKYLAFKCEVCEICWDEPREFHNSDK